MCYRRRKDDYSVTHNCRKKRNKNRQKSLVSDVYNALSRRATLHKVATVYISMYIYKTKGFSLFKYICTHVYKYVYIHIHLYVYSQIYLYIYMYIFVLCYRRRKDDYSVTHNCRKKCNKNRQQSLFLIHRMPQVVGQLSTYCAVATISRPLKIISLFCKTAL